MSKEPKPPTKMFRAHGVQAAVWSEVRDDNGRTYTTHNVKIERHYVERQTGDWKQTCYFRADDLPAVRLVADEAYKYISLIENEECEEVTPNIE